MRRVPDLRVASAGDWAAIRGIYGEAVLGLARDHYTEEQLAAWSGWLAEDDFRRSLGENRLYLVAEVDGSPCGYGQLDLDARRVRAVYVRPGIARRGVGTALLDRLEAAAREAGLESIELEASLNALPFYLARGWHEVERGRHARLRGVELECVLMEKALTAPADSDA